MVARALLAEAVRQLTAWLGKFAGDVALMYGARDGAFIGGGIAPAWGDSFAEPLLRTRFERKGGLWSYLSGLPAWMIVQPVPAFTGLLAALRAGGY